MEELDAEIERVRSNELAPGTRRQYERALVKMVLWLAQNEPALLSPNFPATSTSEDVVRWLAAKPFVSPIQLDVLESRDFERYVVASNRGDGEPNSKSTYDNMRSALVYLHSLSSQRVSSEFSEAISKFYKCLNRTNTRATQASNERLTTGKEPLSFCLYRAVCDRLLRDGGSDCVFAHLFLVITWNLACRAGNACSIRYKHMAWKEDALTIIFAHMKNDQEGERARDPRHVYANPTDPAVCPVLALAIYFATKGFDKDGKLFPGGSQYDRYGKVLRRALETSDLMPILMASGLAPEDFGSHSARKGAATYVSSCSTAGPSAASICLRAGWTLPGVQKTYIRFEAAGDQIVGRFICGLPYEDGDFATLPPFFETANTSELSDAVRACFPGAPPSLQHICEYALASLVMEGYQQQQRGGTAFDVDVASIIQQTVRSTLSALTAAASTTASPGAIGIESAQRPLPAPSDVEPAPVQVQLQAWRSGLRRLPPNFKFQNASVSIMWGLWCCGDVANGHPPYRYLQPSDFSRQTQRTEQKRLADLRALMAPAQILLDSKGEWCDNPTPLQAADWFPTVQELLGVQATTRTGRKRRPEQLSWLSVLDDVRARKRS